MFFCLSVLTHYPPSLPPDQVRHPEGGSGLPSGATGALQGAQEVRDRPQDESASSLRQDPEHGEGDHLLLPLCAALLPLPSLLA